MHNGSVARPLYLWAVDFTQLKNDCYLDVLPQWPQNISTLRTYIEYIETVIITNSTEVLSNCPYFLSQSIMVQVCQFFSSLILLIHFLFATFSSKSIRRIYGVYIILFFVFGTCRDCAMFASNHFLPEILYRFSKPEHLNPITTYFCKITSILIHYLNICCETCLLAGFFQLFWCIKKGYSCTSIWAFAVKSHDICSTTSEQGFPVPKNIFSCSKPNTDGLIMSKKDDDAPFSENIAFSKHDSRKHKLIARLCGLLLNIFGFILIFGPPLIPVLFLIYKWPIKNESFSIYGKLTCGDIGAYLWISIVALYLPVFLIISFDCFFILAIRNIIQTKYILSNSVTETCENTARFVMLTKICICQLIVWTIGLLSNVICHIAIWHLYNILVTLRGIFMFVNFTLSRPILDVYFRRNDPLSRLKIGNLAFQLPMAPNTLRNRLDQDRKPINRSSDGSSENIPSSYKTARLREKHSDTYYGSRNLQLKSTIGDSLLLKPF